VNVVDDVDEGDELVVVDVCEFVADELDIDVEDMLDVVVVLEEDFDDVVIASFRDQITALLLAWFTNSHVTVLPNTEGLKKK
jgi:hypothetical protein